MSKLEIVESDIKIPPLNKEEGSSFGWFDRLLFGWRDGMVFDYGDWEARDIHEMMSKDYKARQLENALALPIVSATHRIEKAKGDKKGAYQFVSDFMEADQHNGGMKTPLDMIVDQMTTAFSYKRAYFEKVWTEGRGEFKGKVVYDKLAWRPQTTCRLMRNPHHGGFEGFEQEAYYVGPEITKGHWPIQIPAKRAFVYIHGLRRDPLNGTSDMEIAYWAWKTKQKILFLWFQFLEAVSLPRVVVKANDQSVASQIAGQIAKLKSSGILPVSVPQGPQSVGIETLDVSGKGAEQFQQAITWLDNAATDAVLAGFLNLTSPNAAGPHAGGMGGSYALSKDASDFFLQMEEAKAREMAYSIRKDLFGPLVHYNLGPDAIPPHFRFEPLNDVDKQTSVEMFSRLMGSRDPALIPDEFIGELAAQVATYVGLDGNKVLKQFNSKAQRAKEEALQQQLSAGAQLKPPSPVMPSGVPNPAAPNNGKASKLARTAAAVDTATKMVKNPAAAKKRFQ